LVQGWACDAAKGFQPIIPIEQSVLDPILAVGTAGSTKLSLSPTADSQVAISKKAELVFGMVNSVLP
jgi:hypothetical protein